MNSIIHVKGAGKQHLWGEGMSDDEIEAASIEHNELNDRDTETLQQRYNRHYEDARRSASLAWMVPSSYLQPTYPYLSSALGMMDSGVLDGDNAIVASLFNPRKMLETALMLVSGMEQAGVSNEIDKEAVKTAVDSVRLLLERMNGESNE